MDGEALYGALRRRLGREGVSDEILTRDEEGFWEALTTARDTLRSILGLQAPLAVQEWVTMVPDPVVSQRYALPDTLRDPIRVLSVIDELGNDLLPSATLNQDAGHYRWDTLRQLQLANDIVCETVAVLGVFDKPPIDRTTDEAAVGLPTPAHRALVLLAAMDVLTRDEQSDARATKELFAVEVDRLERLYGDFDAMGGAALRQALLASVGAVAPETL